mgnify:CR=1 FL=1|tara:strand:- start:171 stop:698 length:528 start_codon:yes stop_codon:yes gene_type:complete
MKNRTFIFFSVIFAFLFSASSWGAKVGTVDLNRVVVGIKEMKGVREKLKAFHMSKQMELKKEEEKISKLHKSFQKKSMVMNEKTKMEKQKEIQAMVIELNKKKYMMEREIQRFGKKAQAPVMNKIKAVIDSISLKEAVDFTLDTGTGQLYYAKNKIDLTQKIIDEYNKKHPVKAN